MNKLFNVIQIYFAVTILLFSQYNYPQRGPISIQTQGSEYLKLGRSYFNQGNYAQAQNFLGKAVLTAENNKNFAYAAIYRGLAQLALDPAYSISGDINNADLTSLPGDVRSALLREMASVADYFQRQGKSAAATQIRRELQFIQGKFNA